jgi:hypothetical protein
MSENSENKTRCMKCERRIKPSKLKQHQESYMCKRVYQQNLEKALKSSRTKLNELLKQTNSESINNKARFLLNRLDELEFEFAETDELYESIFMVISLQSLDEIKKYFHETLTEERLTEIKNSEIDEGLKTRDFLTDFRRHIGTHKFYEHLRSIQLFEKMERNLTNTEVEDNSSDEIELAYKSANWF